MILEDPSRRKLVVIRNTFKHSFEMPYIWRNTNPISNPIHNQLFIIKQISEICPYFMMIMNFPRYKGFRISKSQLFIIPLATMGTSGVRAGPCLGAPSKDTQEESLRGLISVSTLCSNSQRWVIPRKEMKIL